MSRSTPPPVAPLSPEAWFAAQGWAPFPFQREAWAAYQTGARGLIHASTGTGKTYAAYFGPVLEALAEPALRGPAPLRVLWITPLRALSNDTAVALRAPLGPLGLAWDVGVRNGDTGSSERARQRKRLPTVLITTPESLSLLLTQADAPERLSGLRAVVVDEWHELLGTKRGVLTELALARLRGWNAGLRVWGLSATLGNLNHALATLVGVGGTGRMIRGHVPKPVVIDSVIPDRVERFPWAGHLGLSLLPQVVAAIEEGRSALVFTNTRAQTEIWYQAILGTRPDWAGRMALHHGSLDRKVRDWVEDQLRAGTMRCVVCTSSLDLGVDFAPVDRVVQIGSPKGVARLLQRAGRSGHQPGAVSRVTCVPTNVLELVEVAAARVAAAAGAIESRQPVRKAYDLLAQHVVSTAVAGGFTPDALLAEVRTTAAYADLTAAEWAWVLDFVIRGGESLKAYPDYRRVVIDDGRLKVADERIARRHRLAIGTITSDASLEVRFLRGGRLGSVEEAFAARLKPGDRFAFAGRVLEFVRVREMTAWVRKATGSPTTIPRWAGGRMPLSTELSAAVRQQLEVARTGRYESPELAAVRPVLELQARWSRVPAPDELLVERLTTREGHHLFVYPFEGRLVHEGMAALAAYRLSRQRPVSFTLSANDYGFELLSPDPIELTDAGITAVLSPDGLAADVLASINATELAKRQFREIARVSGLVHPGLPRSGRSARQLQASSGLFYDVFREYDLGTLLLDQARAEVLDRQFEQTRLAHALARIAVARVVVVTTDRPTPLAFPLLVQRMRETLSSEKLADRVKRMTLTLERKAGPVPSGESHP
ncbi:ligase-associated DNA damage response DEXH box helicase [Fimbriiglobus ruber]|uniref:Helicase domain protein n=1 Tax=Fimbriiglobus ruber TaxID=1908690 RepID=A0A225DRT3_9BACT|nr:ligase-associated DNA damage response DEXH box helicase [Fimbriiglobus ruber]OWK39849.1 Helicase domain protein [Fimbriiglobus ruber]